MMRAVIRNAVMRCIEAPLAGSISVFFRSVWPTRRYSVGVFVSQLRFVLALVLVAEVASAEVVRIDVRSRDDFGTHERVIARVHYAVDPNLPSNQRIADLSAAPRNASGKVEFDGDLLLFLPKQPAAARG